MSSRIKGAIVSHQVVVELFAEIVVKFEVKPDENVKAFALKAIAKIYIQVCSISKDREI